MYCKQKQFTIFQAHIYLQTERWRSYTSTIPETCYNSSKTPGFTLQVFENSSLEVSGKKRNRYNTSTGARPDRKVRFTREADNQMTGNDFDCMVWNHAVRGWMVPVKASVSGVSLLQLSPIFPSIPFSPETPDTQAKKVLVITTRDCYILSYSFTTHMSQISAVT